MADNDGGDPDPGWRIPIFEPQPAYSPRSNLFTISIHHGGTWTSNTQGRKDYVGGDIACFDYLDRDYFSSLDLDNLVMQIGKELNAGYWWTPMGSSVNDGRVLRSDADFLELFKDMVDRNYQNCDIYLLTALQSIHPGERYDDDEAYFNQAYGFVEGDSDGVEQNRTQDAQNWWANIDNEVRRTHQPDSDGELEHDTDVESVDEGSDGERRVNRSTKTFIPGRPWSEFKWSLGLEFASKEQLREALKEHFIFINRSFTYSENNNIKIRAVCKSPGCEWVVYARVKRRDNTTFRVNTLVNKHTCGIVFNSKLVNSSWLAKYFLPQFRMNPDMQYNQFCQLTANTKYSNVSQSVFYSVKRKARELLQGNLTDQYALLEDYCLQLRQLNPGTTAIVKSEMVGEKRLFQRVYICLQACKIGFKWCRQLIGFDGCFLKGETRGLLLSAVGVDSDNSMFPLAYAVVEKENKESWTWFMTLLKEDLDDGDSRKLTLISDKQKGLAIAEESVFGGAEVRFCVRHLYSNFKIEFPGLLLKQKLWAAAKSTTPEDFKRKMDDLKSVDREAYDWLMKKKPSEWSRSHFLPFNKTDILVNNLCESFNSAILGARDKPIIGLLEHIRFWLMGRFYKKRESVGRWVVPVGPRIVKIIEKIKGDANNCLCSRADHDLFQVNYSHNEVFSVNLTKRICTCKVFQLTGIPCPHAMAAICFGNFNVYEYVHDSYKRPAFVAQYAGIIEPMPSPDKWPRTGLSVVHPPKVTTLPGRPKKNRKREAGEPASGATKKSRGGQINSCGNCGQRGHSRRTCKNPSSSQSKTPLKKGRPMKLQVTAGTMKRRERRERQRLRDVAQSSTQSASHPPTEASTQASTHAASQAASTVSPTN